METITWNSLHPVQQAILLAMDVFEENNNIQDRTYKVRRLLDFANNLFHMDEEDLIASLYSMARDGELVRSQGNVGMARDGRLVSPGARPEFVEVALTDYAKTIIA